MDNQKKACFFALLAVAVWSTVASAFKISLRYLDFIQLLFYSCLTSVLVLGTICLFLYGPGFWRRISLISIRSSLALGFLNPFLYYLVLFKAYDLLPAQQAQPLNYTWGITLALLSIPILKQKISGRQILAIIISYFGTLVISTGGNLLQLEFSNPLGVGLALGSTIIWSLYWIYNTKDSLDPVLKLFLNFSAGLIYISVLMLWTGDPAVQNIKGIAGAVYVGVFEMGITFVFWLMALRLSRTTAQVSNLIYLSPFLSLIFIHFLVGEHIMPSTIAGLILIMTGLIIQNRSSA